MGSSITWLLNPSDNFLKPEAEVAAQATIREAASPSEGPGLTIPGAAASGDTAAVPEVLTLDEAADFLRVDPLVLKNMARRLEVPGRRIGVYWRFSRSALRAWLAGAEVGTAELYGAARGAGVFGCARGA